MQKKLSGLIKSITRLVREISAKRIDIYSACAAFYIFVSFIPFTLIVLSTIKYLPFSKLDLLEFIKDILLLDPNGLISGMIDEMYSQGIAVLSVSIIAALWTSGKGIAGITKGLNEINDVKGTRNYIYLRTRSAICTLLMMIGMILMLVIAVFGNTITEIVKSYVTIPPQIINLLSLKNVFMAVVLFVLFMFLFCVLPYTKIRIRSQIPGAALASIIWVLFTRLFSFYLSTFNGYSMYGSFAVILIIGVWLYTGMYIMFMGALANKIIASRKG